MLTLVVHTFAAWFACTDSVDILTTCAGGNVKACYSDGIAKVSLSRPMFSDARKDFAQACMPTYTKSARPKDNHPGACHELGKLVRDAKGGPQDLPRAVEMFQLACRAGVQESCIDLGMLVYDPKADAGIRSEPARAVEFFFNACNLVTLTALPEDGSPDPNARACLALGNAYRDGRGVENNRPDMARARQMYEKGCEARFAPACAAAGDILARSSSTLVKATELYQQSCKLDARHGCFQLAKLHEKRKFPGSDIKLAVDYYRKTCNIDPTRGCYEAAVLLEQREVIPREGEVESLYNLACEYGHTMACSKRSPGR
ncbi:MAG: tetratricopeptide repeat protein [Myxococcota bacterium]